jgi:ribonuclease P protein component
MPGLVLQCAPRDPAFAGDLPRVGFTASRRVGGAVARNRARRRLRAVADRIMGEQARRDRDYVVIARATTGARDFSALKSDLERALEKLGARRSEPELEQ